jgi:enamine deaminase RidA (YjgF/YER057c/UK114 family)
MRINIPGNPGLHIKLAKAILAKHTALGAASPLNGIEGIASLAAQVNAADTNNKLAEDLYKQAETATEARDKALGPTADTPGCVRFFVTSARDVLAGLNKGSEHKLGEWGFEVNAPASLPLAAKAAAKAVREAIKATKKKPA